MPFLTTLSAAAFAAKSIQQMQERSFAVMSIQEHHELAAQGGASLRLETLDDCTRLVEYIRSFQL